MKIIKNINNNYVIAIDGAGNQLVASGKGIGFGPVPREISDLSVINRSFYDVNEDYVAMINDIPEEIINISAQIVDDARSSVNSAIDSNVVFTLADHINFSIKRQQQGICIKLPIAYDIEHLFSEEYEIGKRALELIKTKCKICLPAEEAAYIALHLINSESREKNQQTLDNEIVEGVTAIVEEKFQIKIDRDSINYSRFATHMHYLLKRGKSSRLIKSDNQRLFHTMKEEYPEVYSCSELISEYLNRNRRMNLTDEERLYLILHINRLCSYEDRNQ